MSKTSPNFSLQVKRKALEPTSIDKLPSGARWQPSDGERVKDVFPETMRVPLMYHPNPIMRALGYHADPAFCIHHRKRFRTRWVCADCGKIL